MRLWPHILFFVFAFYCHDSTVQLSVLYNGGHEFIDWHSCKTKQHKNALTDSEVGLDVKHSNCYKINLPFEIKIQMPTADLGKKGYSPTFAERLEKELKSKKKVALKI